MYFLKKNLCPNTVAEYGWEALRGVCVVSETPFFQWKRDPKRVSKRSVLAPKESLRGQFWNWKGLRGGKGKRGGQYAEDFPNCRSHLPGTAEWGQLPYQLLNPYTPHHSAQHYRGRAAPTGGMSVHHHHQHAHLAVAETCSSVAGLASLHRFLQQALRPCTDLDQKSSTTGKEEW